MYAAIKLGENTITGATKADLVIDSGKFSFDLDKGQLYHNGKLDTISYGKSYTVIEMVREMTSRSLTILKNSGWRIYKEIS